MAKSKTKIYFWLKIDEHFFNNLVIKNLRTIASGDSYVVIYIRMMLESLKDNGVIYYENTMDSIFDEIALKLDENVNDIKATIGYFKSHGLIQIDDEQNAEMVQVPAILAQETNMARYQRKHREKIKKGLTMSNQCQITSNQCHTELEIDIELDKDKEIDKELEVDIMKATADVCQYYQSRIGSLDGFQYEKLKDYITIDGLEPDLVKIAIDRAADNSKRNFGYINAILKNWVKSDIKTVLQQEEEQRRYLDSKASHSSHPTKTNVPEWSNTNYKKTSQEDILKDLEGVDDDGSGAF